ncbi:MAG: hypothetical protein NTV87_11620 [Ignavibacteriae bacterium]|nr:hypothetical protein [Ignavibacteriota bacterium]
MPKKIIPKREKLPCAVHFRCSKRVYAFLSKLAAKTDNSVSEIVRHCINDFADDKKQT